MPIGLGASSVGLSVSGYGSVDSATAPTQTILIDSADGVGKQARKIDPVSGEYVYDSSGSVEGMSGVQQLVLLRIATLLNSSAVPGLGMAAPSGVVTSNILRVLTDQVTNALQDIISAGLIQIVSIQVLPRPGGGYFRHFIWRDLTSGPTQAGTEQTTSF